MRKAILMKIGLAGGGSGDASPDYGSGEVSDENLEQDVREEAGKALITAIQSGDANALMQALAEALPLCQMGELPEMEEEEE